MAYSADKADIVLFFAFLLSAISHMFFSSDKRRTINLPQARHAL
jgi:hypothetical protein